MRNLLAIARKELNVYFNTPIAYVMLCGMTFIGSYFFISFVGQFLQMSTIAQQAPSYMDPSRLNLTDVVMAPLLFNLGIILVFVVPFLSMRLMAEEKRQRTLELLMTAPLRPTEIVLGKYLGGILVLGLSVGLTGIYPAILSHYGGGESGDALEWTTVLLGYVGLLSWSSAALAIGLFISSLTESQVVAAIITFAVLLMMWIINWAGDRSEDPVLKEVFTQLSSSQHLVGFVKGELALKDLVYFASISFLGLFLTQRSIESTRWS